MERGSGIPTSLSLPCLSFPSQERVVSPSCPLSAPPSGKAAVSEAAVSGWGDRGCWGVWVGDPRRLLLRRFGAEQSPRWGSHPGHQWMTQGQAHAQVQACSAHPGSAQGRLYLSFCCILTPLHLVMLGGFWGEQEIWGIPGTTWVGIVTAARTPPGARMGLLPPRSTSAGRGDCCPRAPQAAEAGSAPPGSLTLQGGHENDGR